MAKKLNITPISSDNVCVPSDILGHCEEIYSKFEKNVKKLLKMTDILYETRKNMHPGRDEPHTDMRDILRFHQ